MTWQAQSNSVLQLQAVYGTKALLVCFLAQNKTDVFGKY